MNLQILGAAVGSAKVGGLAPLRFTNTGESVATIAFNDVESNGTQLSIRKSNMKPFESWDLSAVSLQPGGYIEVVGDTTAATEFIGRFIMTGTIAASGSIMSIIYGESLTEEQNLIMPYNKLSFHLGAPDSIFYGCTSLTTAPELPATMLEKYCYANLFNGCTSLTTAPELPATMLTANCYQYMFNGCTSLTTAPKLPATTLTANCYEYMFNGCTSLTTAPELPATMLEKYCYANMFRDCTSLTTAPELPATTLTANCYLYMFNGCTSLTTAPELPATTLETYCYSNMFNGCTSLTTAPKLPATTLETYCYSNMFRGCTSLTTAPELPATTLTANCYIYMFNGCTSLTAVSVAFTNWDGGGNTTTKWLENVAATGKFTCPVGLDTTTRDVSHVPDGWTVKNL